MKLCPSRECKAASPSQRETTEAEREVLRIPNSADAWTCKYCGCVYVRDLSGQVQIWKT
jgi:hypothetical protein